MVEISDGIRDSGNGFLGINDETALSADGPLGDGPLSHGVRELRPGDPTAAGLSYTGVADLDRSLRDTGLLFRQEVVDGMTETGDILLQVHAGFANFDLNNADSIGKLFAPPPGGADGTVPGGDGT